MPIVLQTFARADLVSGVDYDTGRILILPKDVPLANELKKSLGIETLQRFDRLGGIEVLRLPPTLEPLNAVAIFQGSGLVQWAEPDFIGHTGTFPLRSRDPKYTDQTQWHLHNTTTSSTSTAGADMKAPEGWKKRYAAPGIVLGLLDGGVRTTHEDLADNIWTNPREIAGNGVDDDGDSKIDDIHGWNFVSDTSDISDDHYKSHGTFMAGAAAAVANGLGGVGVAWDTKVMVIKVVRGSDDFAELLG